MINDSVVYDYLIIGGGSAGGVLASRLSEIPGKKVLLVEAGKNFDPNDMPEHVSSAYPGKVVYEEGLSWPKLKIRYSESSDAEVPYLQGRGLGGSSLINGIGSNRGAPSDYQEWENAGASRWGWNDVLPYFRKLEAAAVNGTDHLLHGADGPWPIRHVNQDTISGFSRAVHAALAQRQYRTHADQNGEWVDGVFPTAINLTAAGQRASIATTYLRDEVRRRPGLTLMCETMARRLVSQEGRVIGADLEIVGTTGSRIVRAVETVVCAGALHSPALLMRSGIGPAADLSRLGIDLVCDRPGVGRNLMEHPSIATLALIAPKARMQKGDHYHIESILRWSSKLGDAPLGDMHTAIVPRAGWHAIGQQIATLFSWVNKSYSTGTVTLRSGNPAQEPQVDFRMLSDSRDLTRLAMAMRLEVDVLTAPEMQDVVHAVMPASNSPEVQRYLAMNMRNRFLAAIAAPLADRFDMVRKQVVRMASGQAPSLARLIRDDTLLEQYLKANVGGVWHPCGTARMGQQADPMAVTAPDGRVYGVAGLRVCDASLMPTIPCANINVPIIMMAEKIADIIKDETRKVEQSV